jgi:hypothetical protein
MDGQAEITARLPYWATRRADYPRLLTLGFRHHIGWVDAHQGMMAGLGLWDNTTPTAIQTLFIMLTNHFDNLAGQRIDAPHLRGWAETLTLPEFPIALQLGLLLALHLAGVIRLLLDVLLKSFLPLGL